MDDNKQKIEGESEKATELLCEIQERMASSDGIYRFLTERMKEELDFSSGKQWSTEDEDVRDGRPCLVIDKTQKFIDKVSGYFRQNPPQANVKPKFNTSEDVAKVVKGYLRSFLASSKSKACIQTACEHMAKVGYGWIYVSYAKEDPRSIDEYSPVMIRVDDPRSVRYDPAAVESDGSDATWCVLLRKVAHEEAERLYGEDLTSVDIIPSQYTDQWVDGDNLIVADYWWVEYEDDTIYEIQDQSGAIKRLWTDELARVPQGTYVVRKQGESQRKVIKYALATGCGIVETRDWIGTELPIVPVYGRQVWVDNKKLYTGMVRPMMDAQRLVNYYASTAAEVTALAPRAPFILAEGQKEGHEPEWDTSNVQNFANLTYKYVDGAPAPARSSQVADVSPLLQALQNATSDLTDVSGIYEASLGQESGQKSGVAIDNASANSDQVLAIMKDNGSRGVIRACQVAVNMLSGLYTEERNLKYLSEEGEEVEVAVNTPTEIETSIPGIPYAQVDLSSASFDVVIEEGSSFQSKRQEAAKGGIELMTQLPEQLRANIAPEVVKNQNWSNSKKIAKILTASLPPEIRKVVEGEENSKEDPQAMAIMDGMKQEIETLNVEKEQFQAQMLEMRNALQQLQMAVLSTQQDNETKLQIAAMDNQTKIEIEQIKAGTETTTTSAEQQMKLVLKEMDNRMKGNQQKMEVALKMSEKYLGNPSMGPTGDITGAIRGIPGA